MNAPRTPRMTADYRFWLRLCELESRDQPSLLGLSVHLPLLVSLTAPIVPTQTAVAPGAGSATASTPVLTVIAGDTTVSTPLADLSVGARAASATSASPPTNVFVGMQLTAVAGMPGSDPAILNAALLTSVPVAAKVPETFASDTPTGESDATTVTHSGGVPIHLGSPDVPATSPSGPGAIITSTPISQPAPSSMPDHPAPGTGAPSSPTGGGTSSFVLTARTPALPAGAPTGGTGTAATAVGAVPAGTAIIPILAATPTANVVGANTGVVLMPPSEQPAEAGATGSPETVLAKAGLPILGARWDGYLMGLIGVAYGFWHWKRRAKATPEHLLKLAKIAGTAN